MWRANDKDTHLQNICREMTATDKCVFFVNLFLSSPLIYCHLIPSAATIVYRCYCFNERLLGCLVNFNEYGDRGRVREKTEINMQTDFDRTFLLRIAN